MMSRVTAASSWGHGGEDYDDNDYDGDDGNDAQVSYLRYGTLCLIPEVWRVEESDGSAERLHELENGESRRGLFFEDAAKYGGDLEDFQANNFFSSNN